MRNNGHFDVGPCNVTGQITARKARVMWKDGTLHVFRSPSSVESLPTPEPTATDSQSWVAGGVEFTRRGCPTCGWSLGKVDSLKLLELV